MLGTPNALSNFKHEDMDICHFLFMFMHVYLCVYMWKKSKKWAEHEFKDGKINIVKKRKGDVISKVQ